MNIRTLVDQIEVADHAQLDALEAMERARQGLSRPKILALIDERRRALAEEADAGRA